MYTKQLLNVLIVDESLSDIEMINKLIQELGFTVTITRVEDHEDIEEAFDSAPQDILIYSYEFQHSTLKDVRECLDTLSKDMPIICMHESKSDINLELALHQGANTLVNKDEIVHFTHVIKHHLEIITVAKNFNNIKARYLESEKRCQVLMTSSKDAIAYIHEGMHVTANASYIDLFGFNNFDEIEGLPIMDMVSLDKRDTFKKFLRTFKGTALEHKELMIDLKDVNEHDFKAKMEFSPATIQGEVCTQIVIRDQSDSKALEKQLALLSKTDQLTGLFNRRHLIESLDKKLSTVKSVDNYFSFLFISIDKYKDSLEQLGVLGSDQLIANVAKALLAAAPKKQLLCRFTNNRYCLILNHHDEEIIHQVAESLIHAIDELVIHISGKAINSTVSIGVCIVDESVKASSDILDRSIKALALAREESDGHCVIYQPKEGELTQTQLDERIKKQISSALKENRFTQLFKPIISLSSDDVHRYQTMPLLVEKDGTELKAEEYQEAASRTNIAVSIDRWMILNTLIKTVTLLKANKKIKYTFFVTLSSASLQDPTLFRWLNEQIKKFPIPNGSIIFCVDTETALSRLKQTKALATALKNLKCDFCLENFGLGPNPFQIIKHIPVDYIKVHSDFVKSLSTNQDNQQSITQMVEKATALKKSLIVGNIDDPGSMTILWGLGAQLIQGDFISPGTKHTDFDFSSMSM